MQRSIQRTLFATLGAILLGTALPALAQKVREPILQGNPYRTIGGSCVYGRDGEPLFIPEGGSCARQGTAPQKKMSEPSDRVRSLSPELRAEISALSAGHEHMAEELTKLRRAVAEGRKADALQAAEHVVQELTRQMEREERLVEQLLSR